MNSISCLSLVLTFLLIVASCKKDSEKEDLTPRGILTSHGWKMSLITPFGEVIFGYDYEVEDCNLDDCMIFKSDGTYKTNIGRVKCDNGIHYTL